MNIYLPIEVKAREFEGRSFLAVAAAERGHTVILGSKKDTLSLAKAGVLPPGIIHMKSITPHGSMMDMLSEFHRHGHKITVQDEESGILDHSYDTFARLRFSEESMSYTDRVFAWGDFDGTALKEIYPQYIDRIAVTGSPRADFWREDFEDFFRISRESDDPAFYSKPYILIVSNFGSFLNENRFWNILARLRSAGYFDREEDRELHEYENAAYQTRLIGKFVEMIRELAVQHPDYNIVVRPHPVESLEGWERIIGDYSNVLVKREGTISKWIRHAKVMIYNGCTSAMEAATSGINRVAYRPIPDDIERAIPNLLGINTFSLQELKGVVSGLLEGGKTDDIDEVRKITETYVGQRIKNRKGRFAADNIVDEWEAICGEYRLPNSDPRELFQVKRNNEPTFGEKMKRQTVLVRDRLLGRKNKHGGSEKLLKNRHKFPEFREEELNVMIGGLRSVLNRFENVSYERYGEKSFILTRKD